MTAVNKQMETLLVSSEFQDTDIPPSNHQCGPLAASLHNVIISYVLPQLTRSRRGQKGNLSSPISSNKSH